MRSGASARRLAPRVAALLAALCVAMCVGIHAASGSAQDAGFQRTQAADGDAPRRLRSKAWRACTM